MKQTDLQKGLQMNKLSHNHEPIQMLKKTFFYKTKRQSLWKVKISWVMWTETAIETVIYTKNQTALEEERLN